MRLTGRPAHPWQRAGERQAHPGKKDASPGVWRIDGLCGEKPDPPREIALIRSKQKAGNGDAAELGSTQGSGVRSTLPG